METIYLSLVHTGSCGYLFHEIPGSKIKCPVRINYGPVRINYGPVRINYGPVRIIKIYVKIGYSGYDSGKNVLLVIDPLKD